MSCINRRPIRQETQEASEGAKLWSTATQEYEFLFRGRQRVWVQSEGNYSNQTLCQIIVCVTFSGSWKEKGTWFTIRAAPQLFNLQPCHNEHQRRNPNLKLHWNYSQQPEERAFKLDDCVTKNICALPVNVYQTQQDGWGAIWLTRFQSGLISTQHWWQRSTLKDFHRTLCRWWEIWFESCRRAFSLFVVSMSSRFVFMPVRRWQLWLRALWFHSTLVYVISREALEGFLTDMAQMFARMNRFDFGGVNVKVTKHILAIIQELTTISLTWGCHVKQKLPPTSALSEAKNNSFIPRYEALLLSQHCTLDITPPFDSFIYFGD